MHPETSQPRPRFWQAANWSRKRQRCVILMCVLSVAFFFLGIFFAYLNADPHKPFIIYFFLAVILLIPPSIMCFIGRKRYVSQMRCYRNHRSPVPTQVGPNSFVYPVAFSGSLPRSSTSLGGSTSSAIFMVTQPATPIRLTRSRGNTPPPSYKECVSGRASPHQPYQDESSEMHPVIGDSNSYLTDRPPPFNPVMMSPINGDLSQFLPERTFSESLSYPPSAPLLSPERTSMREFPGSLSPRTRSPRSLSPRRMSPGRSSPGRIYTRRESPGRLSPSRMSPRKSSHGRISPGRISPGSISPGRVYSDPAAHDGETSNSPQIEITHYGHI